MCSQALDTLIYGLVVWWGVVDLTIMQLALSKYLFKLLIAALDTPFIYLARDWNVTDRVGWRPSRSRARSGLTDWICSRRQRSGEAHIRAKQNAPVPASNYLSAYNLWPCVPATT